jgi:chemotaxis protein CheC
MTDLRIDPSHIPALNQLIEPGIKRAIDALSQMVNQPVNLAAVNLELVPVSDLLVWLDDPATPMVGVYVLSANGPTGNCHLILLMTKKSALALSHLMLSFDPNLNPSDVDMPDMSDIEKSALGEAGNVISSYFLAQLETGLGLEMYPSEPILVYDMTGAILDSVIADLNGYGEAALVLDTAIISPDRKVRAQFLLMFDDLALEKITERIVAQG